MNQLSIETVSLAAFALTFVGGVVTDFNRCCYTMILAVVGYLTGHCEPSLRCPVNGIILTASLLRGEVRMANEEHLAILDRGVEAWNTWRKTYNSNPRLEGIRIDARNLKGINLSNAFLNYSTIVKSELDYANLSWAVLANSSIEYTSLFRADLSLAELSRARFTGVDLTMADLRGAVLMWTVVHQSILGWTNLSNTMLDFADFSNSELAEVILAGTDLSNVKGLETVHHRGPSYISLDTLQRSKGVSTAFLRCCGLSDADIEYAKLARPGLSNEEIGEITGRVYHLRVTQTVQLNNLFISYNHADAPFVDRIEERLKAKGVQFWRDVHHATAGRLEKQIDRAMRLNPTLLLILSEHSVESDWVEQEAASARDLEKKLKRDVLCPIALDDSWKTCAWPMVLRRQIMDYNILDFSNWQDDDSFARQFSKLIGGLNIFYK